MVDSSNSSESDMEIDELVMLYCVSKSRVKSVWQSEYMKKRNTHGEFLLTKELTDTEFHNYTRLTRNQFDHINSLVKYEIFKEGCNCLEPVSRKEKLTIVMRYLATGDSYKSLAYSCRMNDRTVSSIVREVSEAICVKMQPLFMPEPTVEFWKNVEQDFKAKWNFPKCIGSIDGKHVTIVKPAGSSSCYFNYKGHFSIVLLAAVDAHYRFTLIDVGSMGRFSDSNIFWNCTIGKRIRENTLHIPPTKDLVSFDELLYSPALGNMPHVFVGDEEFLLMQNLMRPFPKRSIHDRHDVKVFNYRLSRARQTVECAFGILATRFRVHTYFSPLY